MLAGNIVLLARVSLNIEEFGLLNPTGSKYICSALEEAMTILYFWPRAAQLTKGLGSSP